MLHNIGTTITILFLSLQLFSQSKPAVSFDDFNRWTEIKSQKISNDGQWICYQVEPFKGDGMLHVTNPQLNQSFELNRGFNSHFSANSSLFVAKIKAPLDTIKKQKLEGVSDKKLPKDSLFVRILSSGQEFRFGNVQQYSLPKTDKDFVVIHFYYNKQNDTLNLNRKLQKKEKAGLLQVFYPQTNISYQFDDVINYNLSENGKLLAIDRIVNDSTSAEEIVVFDTESATRQVIINNTEAEYAQLATDKKGTQLAFLASTDTTKIKIFDLYYWNNSEDTAQFIQTNQVVKDWKVGQHGNIYFSQNGERLFFGLAPTPEYEKKDTLTKDEKIVVDIWGWNDKKIQPQQKAELNDEKKRTYLAVYDIAKKELTPLANPKMESVRLAQKGNAEWALGVDYDTYAKTTNWELPARKDYYLVNTQSGEATLFMQNTQDEMDISPNGKFLYWYSYSDSSWRAYSIKHNVTHELTKGLEGVFYDEENDYPNHPSPYGLATWSADDKYLYVYDRYDIWQLDPLLKTKPLIITNGDGRKNKISYRFIQLDKETPYIEAKAEHILHYSNTLTKTEGFAKAWFHTENTPVVLTSGEYSYSGLQKAKNANQAIWQRENLQTSPDLWYSNLDFATPKQLSAINPWKNNYNWATVELVKWITTDGLEEEGLLYKPENFDPSKKYPMIVYFYRLSSDRMYTHYYPKPSRSVINPLSYASKGYLVFIPNIRYKIGYPGESAFNYVVSGTLNMINKPYVDKDRIGIQGQSWGGYQTAYIVTRTDLYKAASSGAPVSNMTSAYGGIRWQSGMSRMFQYEQTQSRIGGTLWEKPMHYIENSPIFYAPKINTPVLIRHDDADGAVPWYQGIELFMALRRLEKPAWLLNYNGEPHNLRAKSPATVDFSIRQLQFFDHYLKGKPAPVWMIQGIRAIDKGKKLGYELDE